MAASFEYTKIKVYISHTSGPKEIHPCMEGRLIPEEAIQRVGKRYYGSSTGEGVGGPSMLSAYTDLSACHEQEPMYGDFLITIMHGDVAVIENFRISSDMIKAADNVRVAQIKINMEGGGADSELTPPPSMSLHSENSFYTFVTPPNAMGDSYQLSFISRDLHRFPGHPIEVAGVHYRKL